MRKYLIVRKNDGHIEWTNVPILPIDNHQWLPQTAITAFAQLCYDSDALYVRLSAKEEHIICRFDGLYDMVSKDSCLEFFFCPISSDDRYINIECNPLGAIFVGFGHGRYDLVRQILEDPKKYLHLEIFEHEGGWGVSYRIPAEFVRLFFPHFNIESGMSILANCYKCGDETVQPHYIAWNPICSKTPDFHRPEDYGCMIFE